MPLSEHEQRMLDQIERALYAEDPKFASTVRGRAHRPSRRRRLQGVAIAVLGLVLMVVGIVIPFKPAGVPVVSVVGFLVMFAGAVLALTAMRNRGTDEGSTEPAQGSAGGGANRKREQRDRTRERSSFAQRMEERFRKRFDQ